MALAKVMCPVCNELTVTFTICGKDDVETIYVHEDGTRHAHKNEVSNEVQSANV